MDWSGPDHIKIYTLADQKTWKLKSTPDENASLVGWTADGQSILVSEANKSLQGIYELSLDGKNIKQWNAVSNDLLTGASLNETRTHLSFVLQNPSTLPQAYVSPRCNIFTCKSI